jgi:carbon storage regulator
MVCLLVDRGDPKDRGAQMLILARRVGERIFIGDEVFLTVVGIRGDQIRLGIEAPRSVAVHRRTPPDRMGKESGSVISLAASAEYPGGGADRGER